MFKIALFVLMATGCAPATVDEPIQKDWYQAMKAKIQQRTNQARPLVHQEFIDHPQGGVYLFQDGSLTPITKFGPPKPGKILVIFTEETEDGICKYQTQVWYWEKSEHVSPTRMEFAIGKRGKDCDPLQDMVEAHFRPAEL